jgi:hypothetical protein
VAVNDRLELDGQEPELELQPAAGSTPPSAPEARRPSTLGAMAVLLVLVAALVVFYYWRPLPFPRRTPNRRGWRRTPVRARSPPSSAPFQTST